MPLLAKFEKHADLFGRMARTVEADLGGAAVEGRLTENVLRSAVYNCLGCDETGACAGWLEDHADGADTAPGYCRNRALFQRLASA